MFDPVPDDKKIWMGLNCKHRSADYKIDVADGSKVVWGSLRVSYCHHSLSAVCPFTFFFNTVVSTNINNQHQTWSKCI